MITKRRCGAEGGFTLVELMITVAILAILAAIAVVGYAKYIGEARKTEAIAVLADIVSKEQTYRLEFAGYMPLRQNLGEANTPPIIVAYSPANWPVGDQDALAADAFWPKKPTTPPFESKRTAVQLPMPGTFPTTWRYLHVQPRDNKLYCTYMANAGNPTSGAPQTLAVASSPYGFKNFSNAGVGTPITSPFFYALGSCNLSGATPGTSFLDETTTFMISSVNNSMQVYNDKQ